MGILFDILFLLLCFIFKARVRIVHKIFIIHPGGKEDMFSHDIVDNEGRATIRNQRILRIKNGCIALSRGSSYDCLRNLAGVLSLFLLAACSAIPINLPNESYLDAASSNHLDAGVSGSDSIILPVSDATSPAPDSGISDASMPPPSDGAVSDGISDGTSPLDGA